MNPECERLVPLLVRSADGPLAPDAQQALEAHLASCAGCRRALAGQRAVRQVLGESEWPPVQPGFAARVRQRVSPQPTVFDLINWRAWTLRLAPVAALMAFLAWYPLPNAGLETTPGAQTLPAVVDEWAGTQAEVAGGALGIGPDATSDRDALLAAALGETSR